VKPKDLGAILDQMVKEGETVLKELGVSKIYLIY
jgi:hypothetical protein